IYSAGGNVAAVGAVEPCRALTPTTLDYQVPSTLRPAPTYAPGQAFDCPPWATYPSYCATLVPILQPVYDEFVRQFITQYARPPKIREIIATTIMREWWASRSQP